jgi:hypothetical protein
VGSGGIVDKSGSVGADTEIRIGSGSGMLRGGTECKGLGHWRDTLDVYNDVVRVLTDEDSEVGGLGVTGSRVGGDCLHRDDNMIVFAMDSGASSNKDRVLATMPEVVRG